MEDASHSFVRLVSQLCGTRQAAAVTCAEPELFDGLVRTQRLGPLTYCLGHERFRPDFVKNGIYAELRGKYLAEIIGTFSRESIRSCLLKGISYSSTIYDDPAERPMGDIDLMVPEQDVRRALVALKDIGFKLRPGKRVHRARTHHAVTLDRPPVSLDLHRSMVQPWRSSIDLDAVWRRMEPAAEQPAGVFRLEAVDEIVFHLTHIARHELLAGPLAYIDLHRLFRRYGASREAVMKRASEYRLGRAATAVMARGDALAKGDYSLARERAVLPTPAEILFNRPISRRRQLLAKALLLEGPRELGGLLAVAAYERWPLNWQLR